jgi:aspartyl-tRNA(Asn)/glutamyl-tRNA(Gln) amidotransferase subunit A
VAARASSVPARSASKSENEKPLPVGLQLLGKPFGEEDLIKVGHAYEQATDWQKIAS